MVTSQNSLRDKFDLSHRVIVITGGAGLLGVQHAHAIAEMGGTAVLLDLHEDQAVTQAQKITSTFGTPCLGLGCDITRPKEVTQALEKILDQRGRLDGLVNNAANNPKVEDAGSMAGSRFENYSLAQWNQDLDVGLTGAFLCCQVFGHVLAEQKQGVIVNVASDLAVIAPDQRIYREPGLRDDQQMVKPVTYPVVKTALIGLTRYLATYWAEQGVRVNAISPGGVYNQQDQAFVQRLTHLIPLGRMANVDEYKATMIYLLSDASSYMTGTNICIDGGRTCW